MPSTTNLVQPICVNAACHEIAVEVAARASLAAHRDVAGPWEQWPSGRFTRTVRRLRTTAQVDSWELSLEGPLEALGMDPTWVLRLRSSGLEADVLLFYGTFLEVSASKPKNIDGGAFVGGVADLDPGLLLEVLGDLGEAADGGALPSWLRSTTD